MLLYIVVVVGVPSEGPFKVQVSFLQYKFKNGPEHNIDNPPHKNSKSTTPYKRTHPSTIQQIKEVAKDHRPSSAFELVDEEMEKEDHLGIGKLPRSRKQVSDIRKKLFATQSTDDLAVMMERCKYNEAGNPQFVRSVQAAPQPLCVLATDLQLKQLQFCCTDPEEFSVLCFGDPTFNLGAFYVTPVVFLHKAFISKRTGNAPIFLGPTLIHQRMNTEAYSYFAYQLQILLPPLRYIKAVGTDGEAALVNAFENAFPNAVHVRCF